MSFLSDLLEILRTSGSRHRLSREAMNCHAACYRENLQRCSEPMLQYEWVWVEEHLRELRRAQVDAELSRRLGGRENVNILISECVMAQLILQEEFSRRRLRPKPDHGAVVPSEEAWEITSLRVKQEWGIVPA
jgi:hypothetical protein